MRQQPGLLEDADRHRAHIVQCRVVAALVEPLPRLFPTVFGSVAEREKCFLATEFSAATGDVEDLVGLHEHAETLRAQLAGDGDERAVVTRVAAQMGDGDEHLARIADRQPAVGSAPARRRQTGIADSRGAGAEIGQVVAASRHGDGGLVDVQRDAVAGTTKHAPQSGCAGRAGLGWDHRAGQIGAVLGVQGHSRVTARSSTIIRTSHILKHRRLAYRPQ